MPVGNSKFKKFAETWLKYGQNLIENQQLLEKSYRVKNFFTDNYDHPIFEGEIQLIDMIYLKKDL